MNLELERFLENQTEMLGNLTITDDINIEIITDICEEYHKRKLKLLGIGSVSYRRELLIDFCSKAEDKAGEYKFLIPNPDFVDEYLKDN